MIMHLRGIPPLSAGFSALALICNKHKSIDAVVVLDRLKSKKPAGNKRRKSNKTSAGVAFRCMIATLAVLTSLFVFAAGFMTVDLRSGSIMKGQGGGYTLSLRKLDDKIVITLFGKCYEITVKDSRQESVKQ